MLDGKKVYEKTAAAIETFVRESFLKNTEVKEHRTNFSLFSSLTNFKIRISAKIEIHKSNIRLG